MDDVDAVLKANDAIGKGILLFVAEMELIKLCQWEFLCRASLRPTDFHASRTRRHSADTSLTFIDINRVVYCIESGEGH